MGAQVLQEKLTTIRNRKFLFLIMADGGTDKRNLEQHSFYARIVDNDLNVVDDFLDFMKLTALKVHSCRFENLPICSN